MEITIYIPRDNERYIERYKDVLVTRAISGLGNLVG